MTIPTCLDFNIHSTEKSFFLRTPSSSSEEEVYTKLKRNVDGNRFHSSLTGECLHKVRNKCKKNCYIYLQKNFISSYIAKLTLLFLLYRRMAAHVQLMFFSYLKDAIVKYTVSLKLNLTITRNYQDRNRKHITCLISFKLGVLRNLS